MIKNNWKKQGFTTVEVALVLGIAGLIFLMTFIALPTLQRRGRDTQRESDITKLIDMIKKFQTNNRGALPSMPDKDSDSILVGVGTGGSATTWGGFYRDYLGEKFIDPSGENYQLRIWNCGGSYVDKACDSDVRAMVDGLNSGSFTDSAYTMQIVGQAKCARNEAIGVVANSNIRKVAVLYKLEGGGIYCENT